MIEVYTLAPAKYQAIVWEEFFKSRGRGVSLHAHFPWMGQISPDFFFIISKSIDSEIHGGLTLRLDPSPHGRIGTIGLVCVAPHSRGRGLSRVLLKTAIDFAQSKGACALRLWTQKPSLYAALGFESVDSGVYGRVRHPLGLLSANARQEVVCHDASDAYGIPAFASSLKCAAYASAHLFILNTASGDSIAEWQGPDVEVVELMENLGWHSVLMNAFRGDTLLEALAQRHWQLDLRDSNLQMLLTLDNARPQDWLPRSKVPILKRI
jgi:N-acetylglutamate synthase-like GNAT family acetyltransferase